MILAKSIIVEEIGRLMNEATIMSDDRFHFKQQIQSPSFYSYESFTNDYDIDIPESNIIINWSISFWLNPTGVGKLIVDVENVDGFFTIQYYDKISGELKQENQKDIKEFQWKFIINDAIIAKDGSLYVTDLAFDFKNKTCQVTF